MAHNLKPNSNSRYSQGWYTPKNPKKYVGDTTKIRYMSSWEKQFNEFLDSNPNILRWSSEPVAIPYLKPTDNRVHRYFPDYWIKYRTKHDTVIQAIVEVKPKSQTKRSRTRNPKRKLYEDLTYAVNVAKWAAATQWCKERGLEFKLVTENGIFR